MFLDKKWSNKPINRSNISNKSKIVDSTIDLEKSNISDNNLDNIDTLEKLYNYINNFDINLKNNCKSTVICSGPKNANIMIIGEAPGKQEDEQGKPFVGESGRLINKLLSDNDISRESVYVTNVLYWRPENNRTPNANEIALMRPILYKHIELYNPKLIVLLGSIALQALFESRYTITKIRGQLIKYEKYDVIASFHPSYILRNASMLKYLEEDFHKICSYK